MPDDSKKPSIALAFGPGPKDPDEDGDDDSMGSPDGLDAACDELIEALGIDVPEEKREQVCDALKNFVTIAVGH